MKKQKTIIILSLVFVLLLGGAFALYTQLGAGWMPDQLTRLEQQPPATDFSVYDTEGNLVKLSDYFGKPIVLNFWASWCGPCQSEMPDFEEAYRQLGNDIHFLMVNVTGGRETLSGAKSFIEHSGYTFPVLYDVDGDAANAYRVYSLPTTYFIDASGHLIAQATGAINAATLQHGIGMITA